MLNRRLGKAKKKPIDSRTFKQKLGESYFEEFEKGVLGILI